MSGAYARDDRAEALARGTALLLKLLDLPPILLSNKSLMVLVQWFSGRLLQAVAARKESDLLEYWERELPAFKKKLMAMAAEDQVVLSDGVKRPLLTENKADQLVLECPPGPDL